MINKDNVEKKTKNMETYGLRIKDCRAKANMTAEELAQKLQVSVSSIRNWECGISRPDLEYLYKMFFVFDVSPNDFFNMQVAEQSLSPKERKLIKSFRALDTRGQDDVISICAVLQSNIKNTDYQEDV